MVMKRVRKMRRPADHRDSRSLGAPRNAPQPVCFSPAPALGPAAGVPSAGWGGGQRCRSRLLGRRRAPATRRAARHLPNRRTRLLFATPPKVVSCDSVYNVSRVGNDRSPVTGQHLSAPCHCRRRWCCCVGAMRRVPAARRMPWPRAAAHRRQTGDLARPTLRIDLLRLFCTLKQ